MAKYPRIRNTERRNKNTEAKCNCGEIAKFKSHIEWDCMRGNDDVVWRCNEHRFETHIEPAPELFPGTMDQLDSLSLKRGE